MGVSSNKKPVDTSEYYRTLGNIGKVAKQLTEYVANFANRNLENNNHDHLELIKFGKQLLSKAARQKSSLENKGMYTFSMSLDSYTQRLSEPMEQLRALIKGGN